MKKFIEEFKAFVFKGNVIELAVAVVLAQAFKPVIEAVVEGVLMPIIGAVVGKPTFDTMYFKLGDGIVKYGTVITALVSFLLTGLALFVIIKAYRSTQKKEEEAPAAPPAPTKEEVLLTEIRDALRNK
jgi:large conductance mechanosensitive channel